MTAKLIAEEGALEGLVLSFDEGDEWIIGRDPDTCQILVEDPEVSREHLVARRTSDGISIENLSTTNPALVNDEPIDGGRVLNHGDSVKIGGGMFRYYTEIGGHEMGSGSDRAARNDASDAAPPDDESDTLFEEQGGQSDKMLAEIDFNVSSTGRWMLKVIAGPNNGAEFAMEPGHSYIIGTNPAACDIVFHDGTVSRQHAKLAISSDNRVVLQDLKSRNGVFVDDKKIKGKADLVSNSVVAIGTTRFLIFDREADRSTIITPLLPSIVKTLKDEDSKKTAAKIKPKIDKIATPPPKAAKKSPRMAGKLILFLLLAGLIGIIGMATTSLFRAAEVVAPKVDYLGELEKIMMRYPSVKWTFNENNGTLLLIGHVLKNTDKAQLLYNLQGLSFLRDVNERDLVIDEITLQNMNQLLGKNPVWRGVNMTVPTPGRFVLNGYLATREQAEKLSDYLAQNFPYLDLLEKRIFVEEDELASIRSLLAEQGFKDVTVQMSSGELTLAGNVNAGKGPVLERLLINFKKDAAVRTIKNYVVELAAESSIVDLSDTYKVTGSSNRKGTIVNVVINGRILAPGDALDGMTINELKRDVIYLEREGVKYKIEYNK